MNGLKMDLYNWVLLFCLDQLKMLKEKQIRIIRPLSKGEAHINLFFYIINSLERLSSRSIFNKDFL